MAKTANSEEFENEMKKFKNDFNFWKKLNETQKIIFCEKLMNYIIKNPENQVAKDIFKAIGPWYFQKERDNVFESLIKDTLKNIPNIVLGGHGGSIMQISFDLERRSRDYDAVFVKNPAGVSNRSTIRKFTGVLEYLESRTDILMPEEYKKPKVLSLYVGIEHTYKSKIDPYFWKLMPSEEQKIIIDFSNKQLTLDYFKTKPKFDINGSQYYEKKPIVNLLDKLFITLIQIMNKIINGTFPKDNNNYIVRHLADVISIWKKEGKKMVFYFLKNFDIAKYIKNTKVKKEELKFEIGYVFKVIDCENLRLSWKNYQKSNIDPSSDLKNLGYKSLVQKVFDIIINIFTYLKILKPHQYEIKILFKESSDVWEAPVYYEKLTDFFDHYESLIHPSQEIEIEDIKFNSYPIDKQE